MSNKLSDDEKLQIVLKKNNEKNNNRINDMNMFSLIFVFIILREDL